MRASILSLVLTLTLPLLLTHSPSAAAVTWGELQDDITAVAGGAAPDPALVTRISEAIQMLVSYTRAVRANDLTPLFCPAPGTPMDYNQIIAIVREEAQRTGAGREALVQDLLVAAFRSAFPC